MPLLASLVEISLRSINPPFGRMQYQYPHHHKVPLKDLPHTTKLRSDPNIIIQTAPPPLPPTETWAPQYPYLPYDYPKVVGDLGTNLVKHIYEVRPLTSPRGWSVRRPSQMTTLQPKAGLYDENGPQELERSYLADGVRRINLTGPKPQVRVYEPKAYGPFYSPNAEKGLLTWHDLGLA